MQSDAHNWIIKFGSKRKVNNYFITLEHTHTVLNFQIIHDCIKHYLGFKGIKCNLAESVPKHETLCHNGSCKQ